MNRNDTRRLNFWFFLRRQCKRLMMLSLVLAAAWALIPLAVTRIADREALGRVCRNTPGCSVARLCPGWRSHGAWGSSEWRPEIDVCLEGTVAAGTVELPAGTTKQWVPAWVRPLVAEANRGQWLEPR